MVIFYKKWKKYNEIQSTKNKMDLNIRKMTNHPASPVKKYLNYIPILGIDSIFIWITVQVKMYRLGGDLNSVVC